MAALDAQFIGDLERKVRTPPAPFVHLVLLQFWLTKKSENY